MTTLLNMINSSVKTFPLTDFIGIQIDIDLSEAVNFDTKNVFNILLAEKQLLLFRNQKLSEERFIKFSRIFSKPVPSILPMYKLESHPSISVFTNKKDEKGNKIGSMAPGYFWHSDSYFFFNPNKATLLFSQHSPIQGGETHFINMRLAYKMLQNETKEFIESKRAIYKNAYLNRPPVVHPLVRKNKINGEKALFVNANRALGIEGMSEQDSIPLINQLYYDVIANSPIYKHKWSDGDILVWDNPSTMHTATPIQDHELRKLYRILTEGSLPVD